MSKVLETVDDYVIDYQERGYKRESLLVELERVVGLLETDLDTNSKLTNVWILEKRALLTLLAKG